MVGDFYYKDGYLYRKEDGHCHDYPRASGKHYIKLFHKGEFYQYHNVVWLVVKGEIPEGYTIDHIDRDKLNNRIENLRLATKQQQTFNTRGYGKTSKHKGVDFNKMTRKWFSRCCIGGKSHFLGAFDEELEAKKAYDDFVRDIHKEFMNDSI